MMNEKKTKPQNKKKCFLSDNGRIALIFSSGVALFFAISLTFFEVRQIKQMDAQTFMIRSNLIEGYINFYSRAVSGMVHTMQQDMILPIVPENDLKYLKDYSRYNIYGLSGLVKDGGQESRIGTLTGIGSVALIDESLRREIAVTLHLDSHFAAQLEHSSELIWVYYTSARGYIYMAPKIGIDDFQFQDILYEKPFWSEAVPKVNPKLQVVVTSLYEDAAGQGLMITISQPVMTDGKFLGIVSLDIGISSLQNLLNVGQAQGESILVSKDYVMIAEKGKVRLGKKIIVSDSLKDGKQKIYKGKWVMTRTLNEGWLILIHEINITNIVIQAFGNTIHLWIILFLVVIMEYLLLRLRKALHDVTISMNTDQLTKLFNRRGFYSEVERLYNLSRRSPIKFSVMLLDIDHFKQVNDIFGHKKGDSILEEFSYELLKSLRTSDITCRWGGEEFVIFLPATDLSNAVFLAERLRIHIENTIKRPDGQAITVSIGVSASPVEKSVDWAINLADKNLYKAKQSGRNRICFDEE